MYARELRLTLMGKKEHRGMDVAVSRRGDYLPWD